MATKEIGNLVVRKLHGVDKVAYIRFASVYKDFADETGEPGQKMYQIILKYRH